MKELLSPTIKVSLPNVAYYASFDCATSITKPNLTMPNVAYQNSRGDTLTLYHCATRDHRCSVREYEDIGHCGLCNKDTRQLFVDSQHERDSSGDSRTCLECGGRWSGYDDEWTPGQKTESTMTEQEWLACDNPEKMLCSLPSPSDRKLCLYSVASWRQAWEHLYENEKEGVITAEAYADGAAPFSALLIVNKKVASPVYSPFGIGDGRFLHVLRSGFDALGRSGLMPRNPSPTLRASFTQTWLTALVKEVFNPYHAPVHAPRLIQGLALAAYHTRDINGLIDVPTLLVLSDALEEGGYSQELITHLRKPGLHVRGCWALDLLLGRE